MKLLYFPIPKNYHTQLLQEHQQALSQFLDATEYLFTPQHQTSLEALLQAHRALTLSQDKALTLLIKSNQ